MATKRKTSKPKLERYTSYIGIKFSSDGSSIAAAEVYDEIDDMKYAFWDDLKDTGCNPDLVIMVKHTEKEIPEAVEVPLTPDFVVEVK